MRLFGRAAKHISRRVAVTISLGAIVVAMVPGVALAEPEPNNSFDTALAIPVGRAGIGDGEIGPAGDVDYYKFDSAANRTYVIEVLNVAAVLGRMQLYVYNEAETLLVDDDYCRNGTGNVCARAEVTVATEGKYYVRVQANSSSATGTYAVRVLPKYDEGGTWDSSWEPDDTRTLASKIGIGRKKAVDRVIYPRNASYYTVDRDYDTLRFDAPGPRTYVIEVLDVSSVLGRMQMRIYNAAGTLLTEDTYCYNGTGNVCGRVQVTVPSAGTYFIRLNADSSTASGTYSVRVLPSYDEGATWDSAWEPDDVSALAPEIEVGRKNGVRRVIYPPNSDFVTVARDYDTLRFEAPGAGTYTIDVYNVSSVLGRMQVRLYDEAGTSLGTDTYCYNGTGNVCARVRVAVALAGTYFIRVNADSSSASGSYHVRVLPAYDDGLTWDRSKEVNDTRDLAYKLRAGKVLKQTIYPRDPDFYTVAGDYDYYRLSAHRNRDYVVTVKNVSGSLGDTALTIFDSAGAVIADSSRCGDTAEVCNELTFRPAFSDDYFIRVRPDSSTASGSFEVCARQKSDSCSA